VGVLPKSDETVLTTSFETLFLALLIEASGKVGGNLKTQDLFRYEDESGKDFDIKSYHINEYLDNITSKHQKVTAKDFRTWSATWKTASRLARQLEKSLKRSCQDSFI